MNPVPTNPLADDLDTALPRLVCVFSLVERDFLLYALSLRQESTYHAICYTSQMFKWAFYANM